MKADEGGGGGEFSAEQIQPALTGTASPVLQRTSHEAPHPCTAGKAPLNSIIMLMNSGRTNKLVP